MFPPTNHLVRSGNGYLIVVGIVPQVVSGSEGALQHKGAQNGQGRGFRFESGN